MQQRPREPSCVSDTVSRTGALDDESLALNLLRQTPSTVDLHLPLRPFRRRRTWGARRDSALIPRSLPRIVMPTSLSICAALPSLSWRGRRSSRTGLTSSTSRPHEPGGGRILAPRSPIRRPYRPDEP